MVSSERKCLFSQNSSTMEDVNFKFDLTYFNVC